MRELVRVSSTGLIRSGKYARAARTAYQHGPNLRSCVAVCGMYDVRCTMYDVRCTMYDVPDTQLLCQRRGR